MSDGCRVAAARVSCGTSAAQLVAERPESLAWCSAEARHSAERRSKRAGSARPFSGSSSGRARSERRRSGRSTAPKQTATVSDGCRAATARVPCGTAASQLVAKRPESLPWCSPEAWHSEERLSKRADSGQACTGSSRARGERRRSRRATAAEPMATTSDVCRAAAGRVSCGTTASQLVAERRESLAWRSQIISLWPVSYTHLTLPTNREV